MSRPAATVATAAADTIVKKRIIKVKPKGDKHLTSVKLNLNNSSQ
jgi:hypothetical protein